MLNTTAKITASDSPAGFRVVPDTLWIPVVLQGVAKSPTEAAALVASQLSALQERVGDRARVELSEYDSWNEKLAGKSLRGHGTRHHAKAKVLVRRDFGDENFFVRVRALEELRSALTDLDDGTSIAVGAHRWGVSDIEQHREAVTRLLHAQVQSSANTFGIDVHEIRGSHALSLTVVGPTAAYVHVDVNVVLRSPIPCVPLNP